MELPPPLKLDRLDADSLVALYDSGSSVEEIAALYSVDVEILKSTLITYSPAYRRKNGISASDIPPQVVTECYDKLYRIMRNEDAPAHLQAKIASRLIDDAKGRLDKQQSGGANISEILQRLSDGFAQIKKARVPAANNVVIEA